MNRHSDESMDTEALRARLAELSAQRQSASRELTALAHRLRAVSAESADLADLYCATLQAMTVDELTHPDLTAVTREHGNRAIPHADSFWRSIVTRRRKKQLGTVPEKRLGVGKVADVAFAQRAGVRTVSTRYRGNFSGALRDLTSTVLKPVRSSDSRGAFYLFDDGIFAIAASRQLTGWDDLAEVARDELSIADLDSVEWEIQDMVTFRGQPAPDLKFYMFYGEIGTTLEVVRYPDQRYAYFDADFQHVDFRRDAKPHFDDIASTAVGGRLIADDDLALVRELSLECPVPFMRFDFLLSDEGLVFCEMSSAPGMSHDLTEAQDQRLGALYLRAEVRLTQDLVHGKQFEVYRAFSDEAADQPTAEAALVATPDDADDYKFHLRQGRQLYKENALAEAEEAFHRSLQLRFTPWAANSLGRLYVAQNRLDRAHLLDDEARHLLGDDWERPDFFPARRLTDREKAAAGLPLVDPLPQGAQENAYWMRGKLQAGELLELASREGYRITFHRGATTSNVLLVTFGAANSGMTEKGFGSDYAAKAGFDHIYVAQRTHSYYQELSLSEFYRAVAPFAAQYSRVVTYGSSLGAYCALYFGGSIGAKAIASAPRNSRHPEYGSAKHRGGLFRHAELYQVPASDASPVILVDPTLGMDLRYVDGQVRRTYASPEVVEVPFAGHEVLRALRQLGALGSFISGVIEDDSVPDVEWGGPGNVTWHRERGRSLSEQKLWQEAEGELLASLDVDFTAKAARLLASVYVATQDAEKLQSFVSRARALHGATDFLPPAALRLLTTES